MSDANLHPHLMMRSIVRSIHPTLLLHGLFPADDACKVRLFSRGAILYSAMTRPQWVGFNRIHAISALQVWIALQRPSRFVRMRGGLFFFPSSRLRPKSRLMLQKDNKTRQEQENEV